MEFSKRSEKIMKLGLISDGNPKTTKVVNMANGDILENVLEYELRKSEYGEILRVEVLIPFPAERTKKEKDWLNKEVFTSTFQVY